MRKNKITGAIPGAGRKKSGKIKKSLNITPDADNILIKQQEHTQGDYVSVAIIEKNNRESKDCVLHNNDMTGKCFKCGNKS